MNANFTPGPWIQHKDDKLFIYSQNDENHNNFYFKLYKAYSIKGECISDKELLANANLAAAAPELYDALNNFLEMYIKCANSGDWGFWNPENDKEVITARAALKKAKG